MTKNPMTRDRYLEALHRLADSLSEADLAFLRAHHQAPKHTATATDLARAVGFSGYRVTNLLYGKFAAKLEKAFENGVPRSHYGIGVLARAGGKTAAGHILLQMRPELVSALDDLGWFTAGESPDLPSDRFPSDLTETEIKALRASRVGQGRYRAGVVAYWQACAVTGCRSLQLLAASHIKPWRDSSNAERLDSFNGLLLTPNLHALFDIGLISFADDGAILLSRRAEPSVLQALCVHSECRINRLTPEHRKYLRHHRKHVFAP